MLQIRPENAVSSTEPRRCWGFTDSLEKTQKKSTQSAAGEEKNPTEKHLDGEYKQESPSEKIKKN